MREERQIKKFLKSYDPFIDHYCFDDPIQTAKDGYSEALLCQAAKARAFEGVVLAEGVILTNTEQKSCGVSRDSSFKGF